MSGLGKVTAVDNGDVPVVSASLTEADHAEGELYQPFCIDSPPLPGDTILAVGITGASNEVAFCGVSASPGKALPGEGRIVGRSPDRQLMGELWLEGDGTVTLTGNPEGVNPPRLQFSPDGSISLGNLFGGLSISPLGVITANGVEISPLGLLSALGVGTFAGNDLDLHIHNQTVPPGPPPISTTPPVPIPTP